MSFSHHLFFCLNQRNNGEECCEQHNAFALFDYAKKRVKELGLAGLRKIRVNKASCLDRCAEGPVMVIYPQGIWYTFVDKDDVEEIIQSHLILGHPVERLQLT
ncbi:(2Fe-2S) ferredoxin domain-containing protein [Polynucleobacter necessarius]|uniref:(2Fe-2S) ferredoxin domain-containing protein n=1 Tax=Polynucleobacter necessarius TaxID=576610 RepID=UPI000E08FCD9|nr:(2Fe-2S) ferredoxin domain-containing protein [Polynucleobacter necessarius]HAT39552.1 2Fe-2S ferredoxin [Polynucleobacter sp.]